MRSGSKKVLLENVGPPYVWRLTADAVGTPQSCSSSVILSLTTSVNCSTCSWEYPAAESVANLACGKF